MFDAETERPLLEAHSNDQLMDLYGQLDNYIDAQSTEVADAGKRQKMIEEIMSIRMVEQQAQAITVGAYKLTRGTRVVYNIPSPEWEKFYTYLLTDLAQAYYAEGRPVTEIFAYLNKAPNTTSIRELVKEGKPLPPGVKETTLDTFSVKKA